MPDVRAAQTGPIGREAFWQAKGGRRQQFLVWQRAFRGD
jgi:hypothetical protein